MIASVNGTGMNGTNFKRTRNRTGPNNYHLSQPHCQFLSTIDCTTPTARLYAQMKILIYRFPAAFENRKGIQNEDLNHGALAHVEFTIFETYGSISTSCKCSYVCAWYNRRVESSRIDTHTPIPVAAICLIWLSFRGCASNVWTTVTKQRVLPLQRTDVHFLCRWTLWIQL